MVAGIVRLQFVAIILRCVINGLNTFAHATIVISFRESGINQVRKVRSPL